jgi:uncharacterized Zn-binding protein involved in type VI secretion
MHPAARVGDNHECKAHGAGPISPPCSVKVLTNNLPQARATDQLVCPGTPPLVDFIVTGSGTVLINNLPAARQTDKTMHPPPGSIIIGSPNVLIGGPTVGATLGNPGAGNVACAAAAAGRTSGSSQQSYQNCGVESVRQIINQATGANVSEDNLLDSSMNSGYANRERRRADSGGTSPGERQAILAANGVPSTLQNASMANIAQAVAQRRGVVTSHDVSVLWGPANSGGHAIVVTGIRYDANGNPHTIITNDTGRPSADGNCGVEYPADVFANSLRSGRDVNVTTNPIW